MIGSRIVSLGLTAVFLVSPGIASAKCLKNGDLICGKGTPSIASDAPLAVSHGGDFAPVGSGAALHSGDRVLIGAADANIALGPSCQAAVAPGSLVSIRKSGTQTCASITQQAVQAGEVPANAGISPIAVGAGVLAGAGAIALGVALSDNGGNGGTGNNGGGGTVSSR